MYKHFTQKRREKQKLKNKEMLSSKYVTTCFKIKLRYIQEEEMLNIT